jgi:hypothetical protein
MPTHGAAVTDVMMSTQHLRHGYTDENLSGLHSQIQNLSTTTQANWSPRLAADTVEQ